MKPELTAAQSRIHDRLDEHIIPTPSPWPKLQEGQPDPSDLRIFAPKGNGVYGVQKPVHHPILNSPQQDAGGGVIYFDSKLKYEDLEGVFSLWKINREEKRYAVFIQQASDPEKEGFLTQVRVVNRFALRFLYNALSEAEYEAFPMQPLGITELLHVFISLNLDEYGSSYESPSLAGSSGGDGYFAKEALAFGLMLENDYFNILRIWSRAWLVTK